MNSEISLSEEFGQLIAELVEDNSYTRNLEIGSWDGGGSTLCFVKAMLLLDAPDMRLDCIEIIKEKFDVLSHRYRYLPWVKTFNGSSVRFEDLTHTDFFSVWNSPYNKLRTTNHAAVKSWFDRDIQTIRLASSFEYAGQYDCVLIDGGEFTGYTEFQILKDKAKCIALDDVHNAFKCNQAYHELSGSALWRLIKENPECRNGYAVFQRV